MKDAYHDLILRGGHVIDPINDIDGLRDTFKKLNNIQYAE